MFHYKQSFDKSISDELKRRFSKEVEVLEQEGFRFFSLHQEVIWPFSVIFFFPVYVLMANNEYVRVEAPLRITSYHLMYVSEDAATFAYVYGLGCKFYTKLMDGTWIVSNTAQSIRDEKVVVQKREEETATTEQILKKHQTKVQEYRSKGIDLAPRVSFDHWVEIESKFDQSNVTTVVGMGIIWWLFLIWAISWLVTSGISFLDTVL